VRYSEEVAVIPTIDPARAAGVTTRRCAHGRLEASELTPLVAGAFTSVSLERKGLRRFAIDRTVRILGGERGWFDGLEVRLARGIRWVAWAAVATCITVIGVVVAAGIDPEVFAGPGTWQSAVPALLEAVIMVTMSFWLVDLFRRRFDRQGPLARELSRAAHAGSKVTTTSGSSSTCRSGNRAA
jgi:hypothetical protein